MPQVHLDAESIVVSASRPVIVIPTQATFNITVSGDPTTTLPQVLGALDLGLTPNDLISINSSTQFPPPPTGGRSCPRLHIHSV